MQSTIHQVPSQLGVIAEKLEEKNKVSPPVVASRRTFTKKEADYFNRSVSFNGNLIAYGCVLAKKHNVSLSMGGLNKLMGRKYVSSSEGFFDCMVAPGIVLADELEDKDGYFDIRSIDPEIEGSVRGYLMGFADRAYAKTPEARGRFIDMIEKMETAFASGSIAPAG
ncbi:hypothetical protein [Burkholderia pyrrocinia]|uniref:hypothetical protein n=1 Tax=Burkholderia pyrrocinia TaxID=60550 RepID=UPI00158C84C0|nr:hypothetical protein [Burkholderia pyrrocinia]